MGDGEACGLFEGAKHVQDAVALTRPEVERIQGTWMPFEPGEGGHVGLCEVADVEVIPDAGAVRRGVILPKDGEGVAEPRHSLREVGHQVGGRTEGKLPNVTGGVRTDGVEVAEDGHA